MAQKWPKMTQNGTKWPKYDSKWPKMAQELTQNDPKWPKNDPKWPKYDARIYALFPQFFSTEKAVPQTFSLLECMYQLAGCLRILLAFKQRSCSWLDREKV